MTLNEWLKAANSTATALAKRSGLTVSTVTRLARGIQQPNSATVRAIERATAGAVGSNDWAAPDEAAQ